MKKETRFFLITIFLCFSVYLFEYFLTFYHHPILFDDNTISITEKHPNYILDFKDGKKTYPYLSFANQDALDNGLYQQRVTPFLNLIFNGEHIPIFFEYRQGGLPAYMFRKIFYPLGAETSIHVLHLTYSLICLVLFYLIVNCYFDYKLAFISSLFLVTDATFVAKFSYSLTEYTLHLTMLLSFLCFTFAKNKNNNLYLCLGALLLSTGMFIKITFLWYLPIFIFCFKDFFLGNRIKITWPIFLIFSLFYLSLFDFSTFSDEFSTSKHPFLAHNPIRELLNLVIGKNNFLAYLTEQDFIFEGRNFFNYLEIKSFGTLNLALLFIPLFLDFHNKKLRLLYFGAISYFCLMWCSLPLSLKYLEYLYPLNLYLSVILGLSTILIYNNLKNAPIFKNKMAVLALFSIFMAPHLFQLQEWITTYRQKGPVSFIDLKLQSNVANDLIKDNILNPYTINIMDAGRLEFITKNKIIPDHLWHFLWKKKFNKLDDLLIYLSEGHMILTMDWNHRWMMPNWGESDIKKLKIEALKRGIHIFNERVYRARGISRIYRFSFRANASSLAFNKNKF